MFKMEQKQKSCCHDAMLNGRTKSAEAYTRPYAVEEVQRIEATRPAENRTESILGTQRSSRDRDPSIDDVDQLAPPIVYSPDDATSTPTPTSFLANLIFIPND